MNPTSIRKTWLAVAVIQLVLALTVMGETQNAQFVVKLKSLLGIEFLENTPDSIVALWGVLFLSIVLTISFGLAAEHAGTDGTSWRTRFPLRVFDFDPHSPIGRWFTYGGIVLGVLVPLWTLGHSWRVMHSEGVLCRKVANEPLEQVGRGWSALWTLPDDATFGTIFFDGYRLGGEDGCSAVTTTFFPMIESVIFLLLTLWATWNLLRAVKLVFAGKPHQKLPA